ncbi:hypothetical protein [Neptunomonas marina]|uniref:hypothetical protein n=1 Tax=Neptunomonas marina TaxID=1815562 RepID=UPI0013E3F4FA|nr:hypothetical protein [Neptunomonas marina]
MAAASHQVRIDTDPITINRLTKKTSPAIFSAIPRACLRLPHISRNPDIRHSDDVARIT